MVDAIFGLTFSKADETQLTDAIVERDIPVGEGARVVATANLDHVANLSRSQEFRRAYRRAWAVTADGMPVYLYARMRGLRLPGRVTGSNLCGRILDRLRPDRHRIYFVVSCEATVSRIDAAMRQRGFATDAIRFLVPPFGFDRDVEYSRNLVADLNRHNTTHLFLGLGSPKSEVWTETYRAALGDVYVLNFGAGLDYFAGIRTRAPKALQRTGFEWAWRLASEPRRLSHRYLINSWRFLWAVGLDLAGRSASNLPKQTSRTSR